MHVYVFGETFPFSSTYCSFQRGLLLTLKRLVSANMSVLSEYLLPIVARIPSCIPPEQYVVFLPTNDGEFTQMELVSHLRQWILYI